MNNQADFEPWQKNDRIIFAALIGVSVSLFHHLVTVNVMSGYQRGALVSFVLAMPLLAGSFLAVPNGKRIKRAWEYWIDLFGIVLTIIGIFLVVSHVEVAVGLTFLAAVLIVALVTIVRQRTRQMSESQEVFGQPKGDANPFGRR
jgi:hypothetical protein